MDDSLSDLEADEIRSAYDSESDFDQDEANSNLEAGAGQRQPVTGKGEYSGSGGAEISTPANEPGHGPGPSRSRLWSENLEPEVDAGPARPPPDYFAAIANREEEQQQARLEYERSLREEEYPPQHIAPSFDSGHPLVRNGLLGERGGGQTLQYATSNPDENLPVRESTQSEAQHAAEEDRYLASWLDEKLSYAQGQRRYGKLCRKVSIMACLCFFFAGAVALGIFWEDTFASPWRLNSPVEVGSPSRTKAKLQHPAISGCEWVNYKSTTQFRVDFYEVPPHRFSFIERLTHQLDGLQLSGKVIVTSARGDQEESIRITTESATTSGLEVLDIEYDARPGHEVELRPPKLRGRRQRGCLDLAVKIELKRQILTELSINTTTLDIAPDGDALFGDLYDKWSDATYWGMKTESTTFFTEHGEIHGTGWASYQTDITTGNGAVTGVWPLRHGLNVDTQSGDIDISIVPQNASFWAYSFSETEDLDTWASTYRAVSINGTIRTNIKSEDEKADVPSHDYQTEISTVNGDIHGVYLLGTTAFFRTDNGTMNVRIVPLLSTSTNATLHTENKLGFSNVWLIDPIPESDFHPKGNLSSYEKAVTGSVVSEHKSESGSARIIVPPSWSGQAVLETESGHLFDLDDDFEVVKNKTHQVIAKRGDGGGSVTVRTTTGEIMLLAEG